MVKIRLKKMQKRISKDIGYINGCVTISNDGIIITISDMEMGNKIEHAINLNNN